MSSPADALAAATASRRLQSESQTPSLVSATFVTKSVTVAGLVGVGVAVFVIVLNGVAVAVGVAVFVGVVVFVGVPVLVRVFVGVGDAVAVEVAVEVLVGVGDAVAVGVGGADTRRALSICIRAGPVKYSGMNWSMITRTDWPLNASRLTFAS